MIMRWLFVHSRAVEGHGIPWRPGTRTRGSMIAGGGEWFQKGCGLNYGLLRKHGGEGV